MLIDAPAVLGWQRWRELDEQGPLGIIRGPLDAAATGRIETRLVDPFAHIVLAALNELALMIARADNRAEALATGESAVAEFLDRLLGEAPPAAMVAIGSGAIAVARTTGARCSRSGSWRRSGRR